MRLKTFLQKVARCKTWRMQCDGTFRNRECQCPIEYVLGIDAGHQFEGLDLLARMHKLPPTIAVIRAADHKPVSVDHSYHNLVELRRLLGKACGLL
jgi:hypothetical protein